MTQAEWHLALNHLPLAGSLIGALVLLFGIFLRGRVIARVGLVILVCSALLSIPVMESGEGAEDQIEEMGGYSHDLIHEHEELAENFAWVIRATGLLALISYFFSFGAGNIGLTLRILTCIAAFGSAVYGAQVAHEGGKISHPELRAPAEQQE